MAAPPELPVAARPAADADLDQLAELCRGAVEEVSTQRGGPLFLAREVGPAEARARLATALTDPQHVVIAGDLGPATVGVATAHVEELADGQHLGRIDTLYVTPPARGVGVGGAMMADLLRWFDGWHCSGVDAAALPGAREVKNFFEAAGFSARLLVMHHTTPGDA